MFNSDITKKINELVKEQFMLVYDELKKMTEEKNANLNDVQAQLASYHTNLNELLKEGNYEKMADISKETQKISDELPALTKEYEEIKNVFDLVEKYYHNISNYSFTEILNVQKVISDIMSKFGAESESKRAKELKAEVDYYWQLAQASHDEKYYQYAKDAYDDLVAGSKENTVSQTAKTTKEDSSDNQTIQTKENPDEQKANEVMKNLKMAIKTLDKKYLTSAAELISEISSDYKDKEILKEEYKAAEYEMSKQEKINSVHQLLDEVKRNGNEKKLKEAQAIIESLDDGKEKDELMKTAQSLKSCMPHMEFKSILGELENNEIVDGDKLKNLIGEFNKLPDSTQEIYKDRVDQLILSYNLKDQFEKQKKAESSYSKKEVLKNKITEFFGGIINGICATKLYRKFVSKKIDESKASKDDEKLEKYQNIKKEFGIVGGLRLFMKKDKLARMQLKLYKKDVDDITLEDKDKYSKRTNKFVRMLNKKLNRFVIADSEGLKDNLDFYKDDTSNIVKNIIKQKIEAYSTFAFDDLESEERKETKDELVDYVKTAYKNKIITSEESYGYLSEIANIDEYYSSITVPYYYVDADVDKAIDYYSDHNNSDQIIYAKLK